MISVSYTPALDVLVIEGLSPTMATRTVRVDKPGLFFSVCPSTEEVRVVMVRLASVLLGHDIADITHRDLCHRLSVLLRRTADTLDGDKAKACLWAASSLVPEPEHAAGSVAYEIERLLIDVTFYGDTSTAMAAHQIAEMDGIHFPEPGPVSPAYDPSDAFMVPAVHTSETGNHPLHINDYDLYL